MHKPTLYLMLGYPGAGKTTAAEIIAKLTGATHLSSDSIRLELFPAPKFTVEEHRTLYKTLDERTEELLTKGKDVIYDANLNHLQYRQEKYAICKRVGAEPKLIWVQTAREIAKKRASDSHRAKLWVMGENPEQMFDRLVNVFVDPIENEQYVTMDGTKITSNYVRETLAL